MNGRLGGGVLVVLVLAASCTAPTAPVGADGLTIRIDLIRMDSGSSLGVAYTLTNTSGTPDSVEVCGTRPNPVIEQAVADGWTAYAGGVCTLTEFDGLLAVAPGATVRDSIDMGPGQAGVFRLVFRYDGNWTATVGSAPFLVP